MPPKKQSNTPPTCCLLRIQNLQAFKETSQNVVLSSNETVLNAAYSFPTCKEFISTNLVEQITSDRLSLINNKGFWSHAWEVQHQQAEESVVLKTIKFQSTRHGLAEQIFVSVGEE